MANSGMAANNNWVSTISGSTTQYTLGVDSHGKPTPTPSGLVATRAVETQAGWVGQVIVDKSIIHETEPHTEADEAMAEVNNYVIGRINLLFRPDLAVLLGAEFGGEL